MAQSIKAFNAFRELVDAYGSEIVGIRSEHLPMAIVKAWRAYQLACFNERQLAEANGVKYLAQGDKK